MTQFNLLKPRLVIPPLYRPFRPLVILALAVLGATAQADLVWFDITGSVTPVLRRDDGVEITESFPFRYRWCAEASETAFPRAGVELANEFRRVSKENSPPRNFEIVSHVEEREAVASSDKCERRGDRDGTVVKIEKVCSCLGTPELPAAETSAFRFTENVISEALTRRALEVKTADCSAQCAKESPPCALAVTASLSLMREVQ